MANKKRKKPYIVRLMRKIKKTFRMWKRKNPLKAYRLHIITTVCIIAIVAFATFKTGLAHDFVRHFSKSEEASVTEAPAVGVSSGGKSPVLARELRKKIENAIPDNLEKINVWLGKLRPYIKENIPEEEKRKEVFEKIYRMCEKKGDTLTEEELDKALEEL